MSAMARTFDGGVPIEIVMKYSPPFAIKLDWRSVLVVNWREREIERRKAALRRSETVW